MKQPPAVNRKLLRFRPRQEHAVVQRVKKAGRPDPSSFLDQLRLHDRDLTRRPAKADEPKLQPKTKRLAKAGMTLTHAPPYSAASP